jgi:hypothetical protein
MSNTCGSPNGDDVPLRLLRPEVTAALDRPPGPHLLATLVDLAAQELSARERVEVVRAWRGMAAFCAAGQLDAVAALDEAMPEPERSPGSLRPAADELAPVLAIAPASASRLVGLARRLHRDLPAAADALADGRMDLAQVRLLAALTRDLPDAGVRRALEALAVQHAPRRSVAQLRHLLEAEATRLAPAWAAARAAAGREARDVQLVPSPVPGCRRIVADLPLVEATAVWLALAGVARLAAASGVDTAGDPEERTVSQLMADALTCLVTGLRAATGEQAAEVGTPPVAVPGPQRLAQLAEVQVVLAVDTLLGQSQLPGEVPGVGPVDAAEGRSLAADTRWRRLLVDPVSGTLLDRGTTVYAPPSSLREHVVARDGTCVAPTCTCPAVLAQLDHTTDFGQRGADGRLGTTSAGNLDPACERHHHAKTHGGWQLQQPSPGRFTWTTPTGCTYASAAPPLLPGWADRRPEWTDEEAAA